MNSRMRSTIRRTAAGAGALALALGAVACTGGDDEEPQPEETPSSQAPPPASDAGGDEQTPEASDGGGEKSSSPFSDEELDAAGTRTVEALQVLDDQDWEAACGFVLDPSTGTAPEGDRLQACTDGMGESIGSFADDLQPGTFDVIEPSMVEATDNGDGTVSISIMGEPLEEVPLIQGDDGQWYFSIPF